MSGTIEWFNPNNEKTILATPNWIDEGIVPIDMSMDSEYENVGEERTTTPFTPKRKAKGETNKQPTKQTNKRNFLPRTP